MSGDLEVRAHRLSDRIGAVAGRFESEYVAPEGEALVVAEVTLRNTGAAAKVIHPARDLGLAGARLSRVPVHPESARLAGHERERPSAATPDLMAPRPRGRDGHVERRAESLFELASVELAPGEALSGAVAFQIPLAAASGLTLAFGDARAPLDRDGSGTMAEGTGAAPSPEQGDAFALPREMIELSVPDPWRVTDLGDGLRVELDVHIRSRFAVQTYRIKDIAASLFLDVDLGVLDDPNASPLRAAFPPDPETRTIAARTVVRREPEHLPGLSPEYVMNEGTPRREEAPLWGTVDIAPGETLAGTLVFRLPRMRIVRAALHLPDSAYGLTRVALFWRGPLSPPDWFPRRAGLPARVPGPTRPERGLGLRAVGKPALRAPSGPAASPSAETDIVPAGKELLVVRVAVENRTAGLARFRLGESVRLVADDAYEVPPVSPSSAAPGWHLPLRDSSTLLPLEGVEAEVAFVVPRAHAGKLDLVFSPPGLRQQSVVRAAPPGSPAPPPADGQPEGSNAYTRARVVSVRRAAASDGRALRVIEVLSHLFHDGEVNLPIFRDRMRLRNLVSKQEYAPDAAATLEQPWPLLSPDEIIGHGGRSRRRFQIAFAVPEDEGDVWAFDYHDAGGPIALSAAPAPAVFGPDAPNTHREAAAPLGLGVPHEIRLGREPRSYWFVHRDDGDRDRVHFVRLELPEVTQSQPVRDAELDLRVHANGAVVSIPLQRQTAPGRIWHEALLTGVVLRRGVDYHLEVTGRQHPLTGGVCRLTMGLLGAADGGLEVEQFGDTAASSMPLVPGRAVRGWGQAFGRGADIDWFHFEVPGPGTTHARLSFAGVGEVALFQAAGTPGSTGPLASSKTGHARRVVWPDLPLDPGVYRVRLRAEPAWLEEPYELRVDLLGPWDGTIAPPWAVAPEQAAPLAQGDTARGFLYTVTGWLRGQAPRTTGLVPMWAPYKKDPEPARITSDVLVRWFAIDVPEPEPVLLSVAMTPVRALFNVNEGNKEYSDVGTSATNHVVALVDAEGKVLAEAGWRLYDYQALEGRKVHPQDKTIFLHHQPLPPGRYHLEVKARDPSGRAVPEQPFTLRWTALPVRAPALPVAATLPPDLGLDVRTSFREPGPEGPEVVRVDPGAAVRVELEARSGSLSLYPRHLALMVNQRGAVRPHEEALKAALPRIGDLMFVNDRLSVVGVRGGKHEVHVAWSAPDRRRLDRLAKELEFPSQAGDYDSLSFSMSQLFDAMEEVFAEARGGARIAVLLTDTTPPYFGAFDPVQLALCFRRLQILLGIELRIVFVDGPADEGALPSPWAELVRMATPEDGRRIWTGLAAGASLADVLEQVGADVLTTVARDIDLRFEVSPGAALVIEPGAQDPPDFDAPSGDGPGALRWRLPDLAFTRSGALAHVRTATLRNEGAATWTVSTQARTSLSYTDPTGKRRAQRFGPGVGPADVKVVPRPDGPGHVGGGEVSVPSARGVLSVETRGPAPPPAQTTLIIVDTSGSMATETPVRDGDRPLSRMDVAKRALRSLLEDRRALPEGRTLGVLRFEADGASVIWPLQEVKAAALAGLRDRLDALVPGGGTPIQASLDLARVELGSGQAPEPAAVLLVTDGKPSEDAPYTATLGAAAALHRDHPAARLHVLAVDQTDADGVAIGKRLAALGGGAYFDVADDVESLLRDLRAAVQPAYDVVDAQGVFWGSGVLTDEPGRRVKDFDLPVGTYFVKVAGREPIRAVVREGRVSVVALS